MANEGEFPKINGDVLYASEANMFISETSIASGLAVTVSTGSSTLAGHWAWTNGSVNAVTDNDLSTYWAGSWISPVNRNPGSVTLNIGVNSYRRAIVFAGSIEIEGTDTDNQAAFRVNNSDVDGASGALYGVGIKESAGASIYPGSFISIFSGYKTRSISANADLFTVPGSVTMRIYNIDIL